MAEYIEKNKAINAVFEAFADGRSAYIALEAIPAADVAPIRRGRWHIVKLPPSPGYKAKECSECKCNFWDLEEWDYCPNCGSRMEEQDG